MGHLSAGIEVSPDCLLPDPSSSQGSASGVLGPGLCVVGRLMAESPFCQAMGAFLSSSMSLPSAEDQLRSYVEHLLEGVQG